MGMQANGWTYFPWDLNEYAGAPQNTLLNSIRLRNDLTLAKLI